MEMWVYVVQYGTPIHIFGTNPRYVVLEEVVTQRKPNYGDNSREETPIFS